MNFIKLTNTTERGVQEYTINCDKICIMIKEGDVTWVNLGDKEFEFKVDQTPEEILKLIQGGNK
jgi:hypothetical protein